jgi:hypothetical protein
LASFGQAVSAEKIFLTLANQKQELPLAAIFVGGMKSDRVKMISTAISNYPEILKKI